ncbi:MAG: hypothetical protein Kow0062_18510 [Acidobacteriota bacterium]
MIRAARSARAGGAQGGSTRMSEGNRTNRSRASSARPRRTPRRLPEPVRRALARTGRAAGIALLLAGTLGAAFGFGLYLTLRAAVSRPELVVPDVVDLEADEARALLERSGLRVAVSGSRHDPNVPAGKVLEQFPLAGTRTKRARPVRLVLSLGPARAVVPDLAGMSARGAQLALRAARLSVRHTMTVPSARVPIGRVISQDPPPGTEAYPGDRVALLVSAGPPERAFVMPDLEGRAWSAVRRALERAGFRRIRARRDGSTAAPGEQDTIADQWPRPGHRVRPGDRVSIVTRPPMVLEMEIPR